MTRSGSGYSASLSHRARGAVEETWSTWVAGPRGCPRRVDWVAWHGSYDQAGSLARRLSVVRTRIGETLDAAGVGPHPSAQPLRRRRTRCPSPRWPRRPWLRARPRSSNSMSSSRRPPAPRAGSRLAGGRGPGGDAGDVASFADVLPVDLLFCAASSATSRLRHPLTIAAVPSMLPNGGTVIWTAWLVRAPRPPSDHPALVHRGRPHRSGVRWGTRALRRRRGAISNEPSDDSAQQYAFVQLHPMIT